MISKKHAMGMAIEIANAIKENTQSGKDRYARRFIPYSKRPFAMPYGAVANKAKRKKAIKDGEVSFFTNNTGTRKVTNGLWIVWKGGYVAYKGYMMPRANTNTVDLTFRNHMLKSLKAVGMEIGEEVVLKFGDGGELIGEVATIPSISITIGFTDKTQRQKAIWNIQRGRDFLGLPDEQLDAIISRWLDVPLALCFQTKSAVSHLQKLLLLLYLLFYKRISCKNTL